MLSGFDLLFGVVAIWSRFCKLPYCNSVVSWCQILCVIHPKCALYDIADPYSAPDIDIGKDDAGAAAKVATIVVTGLGFSATAIIGTAYGLYREVKVYLASCSALSAMKICLSTCTAGQHMIGVSSALYNYCSFCSFASAFFSTTPDAE